MMEHPIWRDPNYHAERTFLLIVASVLISLVAYVPFLFTLMRCLQNVHPRNRLLPPWTVWLMMIPIVNIFWRFILADRTAASLDYEYEDRRIPREDGYFGRGLAWTWGAFAILSYLPLMWIGGCWNLVCLPLFILYWVKIYEYGSELHNRPGGYRGQRIERKPRRDSNRYMVDDDDD